MPRGLVVTPTRRFRELENLRSPIDRAALQTFRAALLRRWPTAAQETGGTFWWGGTAFVAAVAAAVVWFPIGLGLAVVGVFANGPESLLVAGIVLAPPVAVSALLAWPLVLWLRNLVRRERAAHGGWRHWYRLTRFAALNDLAYLPAREAWGPTSLVFSAMSPGEYRDVFVDGRAPMLQFGNRIPWKHNGITALGIGAWGFLTIELAADGGRMLLQPRRSRHRFADLGPPVALPPDYAKRFTLRGSSGTYADPLHVITPELLRLLTEELQGSSIEVRGRQLVLTTPRPWNLGRAWSWTTIERVASAVTAGARTSSGTDISMIGDITPRVAPGFVTPPPRVPVRWRFSILGIVVIVALALGQLLRTVGQ